MNGESNRKRARQSLEDLIRRAEEIIESSDGTVIKTTKECVDRLKKEAKNTGGDR